MKAKELIEQLKGYEEFEIVVTVVTQAYAGARPEHNTYKILGVGDIGHSDKVIDLDVEFKD